jgi:hypothetical protein
MATGPSRQPGRPPGAKVAGNPCVKGGSSVMKGCRGTGTCGCGRVAQAPAFQAGYAGSIPAIRSAARHWRPAGFEPVRRRRGPSDVRPLNPGHCKDPVSCPPGHLSTSSAPCDLPPEGRDIQALARRGLGTRAASMTGDAPGSYPGERGSRPWRRTGLKCCIFLMAARAAARRPVRQGSGPRGVQAPGRTSRQAPVRAWPLLARGRRPGPQ